MKKLVIYLALLMLPLSVQAEQVEIPIDNTLGDSTEMLSDAVDMLATVYDTIVECEMKQSCMIEKLTVYAKESKNPMLQDFAQQVVHDSKPFLAEITFLESICDSEQMLASQKGIMICLKDASTEIRKGEKPLVQIVMETEQCVPAQLQPLAEQGNVYAMFALADKTAGFVNAAERQKWEDAYKSSEDVDTKRLVPMCSGMLKF